MRVCIYVALPAGLPAMLDDDVQESKNKSNLDSGAIFKKV